MSPYVHGIQCHGHEKHEYIECHTIHNERLPYSFVCLIYPTNLHAFRNQCSLIAARLSLFISWRNKLTYATNNSRWDAAVDIFKIWGTVETQLRTTQSNYLCFGKSAFGLGNQQLVEVPIALIVHQEVEVRLGLELGVPDPIQLYN